jgi:hypothetical protein
MRAPRGAVARGPAHRHGQEPPGVRRPPRNHSASRTKSLRNRGLAECTVGGTYGRDCSSPFDVGAEVIVAFDTLKPQTGGGVRDCRAAECFEPIERRCFIATA